MTKIIRDGEQATDKLLAGAKTVARLVGSTIGPYGKNVIIERKYNSPLVTNDGVTVARHIYLDDETEDLGAQVMVEAAMKTNEQAGDGTSSTVVVTEALVNTCFKKAGDQDVLSGGGNNVMTMFREIQDERTKVTEMIKEQAQEVDGEKLRDIVTTSLENEEYGKIIAEMIEKVGKDGYIDVHENWATKYGITTETILGMRFLGTYATPYMMTNAKKEAVMEDTAVLVTNHHINTIHDLTPITKQLGEAKLGKIVVITEKYNREAIEQINAYLVSAAQSAQRPDGKAYMKLLAVKSPSLTSEELEDVAVFLDAKFIDKNAGTQLADVKVEDLGHVEKIVVDQDNVVLTGGRGDIEQRMEILNEQLEEERDNMFKEKLKRRIASLSSGVGIIRVGAMTEQERTYWKYKIEDAVHAAQAAVKEGYVAGGGKCLYDIAEQLGRDHILYDALQAPYKKIRDNAGKDFEVPETVIDPAQVVRFVVENGCSAAGTLITCGGAISDERQDIWKKFVKNVTNAQKNMNVDDFRETAEMRDGSTYGQSS